MQEPPEKLVGRYDIVHVRLFLAVVNNDDPSPLLDHCIKLLRPGGVLQWDEFDPSGHQTVSTKGSQSKNLEKLSQYVKSTKPVRWVTNLPQTFQAHGLDVIALATQREHPWQRAMYMETWSVLAEEFASNFLDIHGPLGSGDELRQLAQRAYEEVKQGSSISQVLQVVVGRKPGGEHLGM
ncbi:hypothetical protein MMC26_006642 [Xylographa opegraphella]|nr:hypothetical protein [Xylographa opegraphella]